MPVALREALWRTALAAAVFEGWKVGCFSLAEGVPRNAFAEAEFLTAGREASSRLDRAEALVVSAGVGVAAAGAGTAAVYSGCGQMATAIPEARTPVKAIGATTRPTRTASGGRSARRGRERANVNQLPRVNRPRPNRYLRGSLDTNDHKFTFGGPKFGPMWRRSHLEVVDGPGHEETRVTKLCGTHDIASGFALDAGLRALDRGARGLRL